jgi:hypothetical protein
MATPEKIAALADFIDRLEQVAYRTDMLPEYEAEEVSGILFDVLHTARDRLVAYLAYTDNMLVGTEYCNECGEVQSVVTGIEREPELISSPPITASTPQTFISTTISGSLVAMPTARLPLSSLRNSVWPMRPWPDCHQLRSAIKVWTSPFMVTE